MADPDPIEDANLRGDRVILVGQRPDGAFVPVRVSDDGSIETSAGDGAGQLPPAAELADATANPTVPSLGSYGFWYDVVSDTWIRAQASTDPGLVLGDKFGQHVFVLGGEIITSPSQQFLLTSPPLANDPATAVRIVGTNQTSEAGALCVAPPLGWAGSSTPADDARGQHVRTVGLVKADLHHGGLPVDGSNAVPAHDAALYQRKLLERVTEHGDVRIAERRRIIAFRPSNVENADVYGFIVVGSATHQIHATTRSQEIAVTAASGDSITWQSHTKYPLTSPYIAYGDVAFSDAGQVNQVREIAVGDTDDYVGLRFDGTNISVYGRSAITGATFSLPRGLWLDPLDGTGSSGIAIDWTSFNRFEAAGGVGGLTEGFASINGIRIVQIPASFNTAGLLRHSEHPLRATITNTGASSPGHVRIKGFRIDAVGDYAPQVQPSPAPPSAASRSVGVGGLPVLSIRAKATLGGAPWRGNLQPRVADISAAGGQVRWELIKNPTTLTGAVWASAGAALGMEYDVTATAVTIGGGQVIANGTLATSVDSARIDLSTIFKNFSHALRIRVDGASDVLVLFVAATIGSATVRPSLLVDVSG